VRFIDNAKELEYHNRKAKILPGFTTVVWQCEHLSHWTFNSANTINKVVVFLFLGLCSLSWSMWTRMQSNQEKK